MDDMPEIDDEVIGRNGSRIGGVTRSGFGACEIDRDVMAVEWAPPMSFFPITPRVRPFGFCRILLHIGRQSTEVSSPPKALDREYLEP